MSFQEFEEQRSGETIAFVGPSGAGKSTLFKLLAGLYLPVSGSILFNEAPSGGQQVGKKKESVNLPLLIIVAFLLSPPP